MIHIIKNYKWIIASSLFCIIFGLLTFFTFINQGFIRLNEFNLKALFIADIVLLVIFSISIIYEVYKILIDKKKGKIGSETSLRYLIFFSTTTLLPSLLIAVFSLFLFNVGLQKYFDSKIKTVINSSAEVAKNYVEQTINSVESDILLVTVDINNKSKMFYENPKRFNNVLSAQRLLRRLDEVYLLDSSANIIMYSVVDANLNFIRPPEEAFERSLSGSPVRINDSRTNRTTALVKLDNFIDTYLYIVKYMDPKLINYLRKTNQAVDFYYNVQDQKTGIKITFAIIYLLVVSLLLFLSIIISISFASKLKKQQDKLLTSERHAAWESVARKLAHEIKNPLTPIQLSIDRIKEKYLNKIDDKDNNFLNYLNTITKQINDIEHLVNEFSDFARMPKPILKKISLKKLISRSVNLHELSEESINFDVKKGNFIDYVKGDEDQLNRVFINLLKNSIESINEKKRKNVVFKGKINVEIKEDSDYIYATIQDNGVGFNKVDKTKMLTPYYTTKTKGTGLGLAIVTKILSDHNATIIFNSLKDGAEVKISLPKYYD